MPDTTRIAEFYAQTLISMPGIAACRVCLGGRSIQAGEMASSVCAECETLRRLAQEADTLIPANSDFRCTLADQPNTRVIPVDSYQHHFGFFVAQIENAAVFEAYHPFISNLSNYVALILENRLQKDLLQQAHAELESRVEERTRDLTAANEALDASRLAALNIMHEAIEARQRAEQANVDLQREVTERKRAEEALRKSAEEIYDLYDRAPCGYHSLNRDGVFIRINDTELQWMGYTREEIIGKMKFSDFITGKSLQTFKDNFPLFMERGWVRDLEFEMIRKDGTLLPVLVSGTAIYDDDGNYVMSRSTVYDISERKRAEEKLQERERHSQSLLHLSRSLESAQTYDEVLNAAQDEVRNILGYQNLWAYLFDPDKK